MRIRWLVAMAAAGLALVPTASAQTTLKMGGSWWSNRGPLIDIPLNGGAEFRNPLVNGLPCFQQTGCFASFKQREGGVMAPLTVGGADVPVTTNGTAPGTFLIPPGAFSVNSVMDAKTILVTILPTVVQLQTNFNAVAPGSPALTAMSFMSTGGATLTQILNPQTSFMASQLVATGGGALSPTPITIMGAAAQSRLLRANAWTTQTGRLSPDFGFCQGGATGSEFNGTLRKVGGVVNCTTPNITNDPAIGPYGKAYNGLVQYTGGANAFGGTMMMLLDGGGTSAVRLRTTPPSPQSPPTQFSGTTPVVCFAPIGAPGAAGLRNQITGAGYAFQSTAFLQGGPCHRGYVLSSTMVQTLGPLLPTGTNVSTFPTPEGGTIMIDNNELPGDRIVNLGFPFTSGTVQVINTGTVAGQPANTTFTAAGSLNTSMGEGNITLVAGALAHRVLSNNDSSILNVVRMSFTPEPGATLMLVIALFAIAGLYLARRRAGV